MPELSNDEVEIPELNNDKIEMPEVTDDEHWPWNIFLKFYQLWTYINKSAVNWHQSDEFTYL